MSSERKSLGGRRGAPCPSRSPIPNPSFHNRRPSTQRPQRPLYPYAIAAWRASWPRVPGHSHAIPIRSEQRYKASVPTYFKPRVAIDPIPDPPFFELPPPSGSHRPPFVHLVHTDALQTYTMVNNRKPVVVRKSVLKELRSRHYSMSHNVPRVAATPTHVEKSNPNPWIHDFIIKLTHGQKVSRFRLELTL
ncbi:hypothetical protein B0H14DRAFT_2595670 [Mycena olivaceomarginata]|nr:hypothetical protein B0H14DRAFT_2595670 [Mycena olivaceomarginata]